MWRRKLPAMLLSWRANGASPLVNGHRFPPEPETQMALPTQSAQEAAPEVPPAVQNAAVAEISQAPTSKGSRGHPVVCFRPCIRLAKGICEMGDACDYCHYKHPRYVTPDKRQRFSVEPHGPLVSFFSVLLFLHIEAQYTCI